MSSKKKPFKKTPQTTPEENFIHTLSRAENTNLPGGIRADASYYTASAYAKGIGTERNCEKAVYFMEKAAELYSLENTEDSSEQSAVCECTLGNFYLGADGFTPDFDKAVIWLKRAAGKGNSLAANNLGMCYFTGKGVEKDNSAAFAWFVKAGNWGSIEAIYNTAQFFYAPGNIQSPSQAFSMFQRAAYFGHAKSKRMLGICYRDGTGTEKNLQKAFDWLLKAVAAGISEAQEDLETVRKEMDSL